MADKILYTNKEELIDDESIPLKNKVTADDMNEIKEVVNSHADDIETLETEKADKTEIPTDLSELSNENTKFVNETQLAGAVNEEKVQRQDADNIINNTIATISVDYGKTIELSIDSSTFILTATLKNKNGTVLSSSNIDLPIESVVVNGRYDSASKTIILTLQNGNTIEIPVGDLISGLQSEITPQNKLSSDLVDDTNHTNKFVTQSQKEQIETNKNDITNLSTDKEDKSNKVTELSNESTDTQYPSAKAVYDNESALKEKLDRYKNTIETELGDSTDTGTDLTLNGTAEFDVDLSLKGNTEQATNIKTYTCIGTETGDYYFTYDDINYQFTMPTIEVNSILAFNTDTLKLYLGETEITTTTDNTGTLITLQDTPSPEYPQTVQVVKGNNEVKIENKNLLDFSEFTSRTAAGLTITNTDGVITLKGTLTANTRYELTTEKYLKAGNYVLSTKELANGNFYLYLKDDNTELASLNVKNNSSMIINLTNDTVLKKIVFFANGANTNYDSTIYPMLELNSTRTEYKSHKEQTYPITLPTGMEMCGIGDYADEFVYQNSKWYKYVRIQKKIFDGTETWSYSQQENNVFVYNDITDFLTSNFIPYSNKYLGVSKSSNASSASSKGNNTISFVSGTTYKRLFVVDNRFDNTNDFKSDLANNNLILYYPLEEPVLEEITDTTLINQLNNIKEAYTYQGQTNISQTNEDLPFIIKADFKLSNLSRIEALESALETVSSRVDLLEE